MNKSQDLKMVKTLTSRNSRMYIVKSEKKSQHYVMKTFQYRDGAINTYFLFERRFYWLKHPNVISLLDFSSKHQLPEKMKG